MAAQNNENSLNKLLKKAPKFNAATSEVVATSSTAKAAEEVAHANECLHRKDLRLTYPGLMEQNIHPKMRHQRQKTSSPTGILCAEGTAGSNSKDRSHPVYEQHTLSTNQSQLEKAVNDIKGSVPKNIEILAQNQLLRECKVILKNVETSVCKMTGEVRDKLMDEIASVLPLHYTLEVQRVEEKLKSAEYAQAMTAHLHKIKGISENIPRVVKEIFTDELMEEYNWSGGWEKKDLEKLSLFQTHLRDVFILQGHSTYEKGVKKAVELSHHRVAQRKFTKKPKKKVAKASQPPQ